MSQRSIFEAVLVGVLNEIPDLMDLFIVPTICPVIQTFFFILASESLSESANEIVSLIERGLEKDPLVVSEKKSIPSKLLPEFSLLKSSSDHSGSEQEIIENRNTETKTRNDTLHASTVLFSLFMVLKN